LGKTFTLSQLAWRWYANNAAEPSTALAAQITKPTLADSAIIRLRINVAETGDISGSGAITLEYSTNDTDFTAFGAGNHWDYANGAATEGNTITGTLITPAAGTLGLYHESGTITETWAKSGTNEFDVAIQQTGTASASTTYYFRVLRAGVVVVPSASHPQVLTAATAAILDCIKQTYALSGKDVTFKAARLLDAVKQAYTFTGNDVTFVKGYSFTAEVGAFTLTGNDVTFTKTYILSAEK